MSEETHSVADIAQDLLTFKRAEDHEGPRLSIVVIPGNPGVIHYYKTYMEKLHESFDGKVEVCGISHSGHSLNSHTKELFSLEDQIDHKLKFVNKKLQEDTDQVILVGHSVGAYMALKVLNGLPEEKVTSVSSVFGLYPTIQYIGSSPNGKVLTPMFRFRALAAWTAGLIYYTPSFLKKIILSPYFVTDQSHALKTTHDQLISYKTVYNCLHMANIEMRDIQEVDDACLRKHSDKIVLYFAPGDKWAPEEHHDDIKEKYPDIKTYLCEDETRHAFCTFDKDSTLVANKTSDWASDVWSKLL